MTKFLLKSFAFIFPLIFLAYLFDFFISNKLSENHDSPGEYEVWNDIYKASINAEIAIYGSSRAWVHIDPKIFEDSLNINTYNFGVDGQNFRIQYLRHKEYFKYNKHPKIVILSVDVFSLAKRKDLYQKNQFLPYMLWNRDIYHFTNDFNGFLKADYFVPLQRFAGKYEMLKKLIDDSVKTDYRYHGYKGMERQWNNDFEKAKKNKKEYRKKIDPNILELLEKFILELKDKNIYLIFVYTPEYIEGQKFVKNRKDIITVFNNLSDKYNIPFFNYSSSKICSEKNLFYNASHMNKEGSEIFTNILIKDLEMNAQTSMYITNCLGYNK